MAAAKKSVSSGTVWEDMAGYSRAVRIGDRILVSGTTATGPNGLVGGNDAAAQTQFVIDKIETAIEQLGGRLHDVVRTRVYVSDMAQWEAVARAHGERFDKIRPANTLVQAKLVGDEYLVEIEAEAVVGAGDAV
jgi:enamine deaminase RidA (YjgF/YER057c/UK114 family)